MTGGKIYLKCENRQKTGSFKIRGASNKIAAMIERGDASVQVLPSTGRWWGVTYREDKPLVQQAMVRLRDEGVYPAPLWG